MFKYITGGNWTSMLHLKKRTGDDYSFARDIAEVTINKMVINFFSESIWG